MRYSVIEWKAKLKKVVRIAFSNVNFETEMYIDRVEPVDRPFMI